MNSAPQATAPEVDELNMDELIARHTPLIWSIVRRFFGRGTEPDDLFQIGCIGFIKAVRGFSAEYGTQFSTYAVPKIAGEIKRFLRDDGMIKVSRTLKEHVTKVRSATERFELQYGRTPHISELCELTGLSIEEIAACNDGVPETYSLDASLGQDGDFNMHQVLHTDDEERHTVDRLMLHAEIERLDPKQRAVLIMRYFRDMTQQSTADALGISQVQVSRLEKRALSTIRMMIKSPP